MIVYLTPQEIMQVLLDNVSNAKADVGESNGDNPYAVGKLSEAIGVYTQVVNMNESKRRELLEDTQKAAGMQANG